MKPLLFGITTDIQYSEQDVFKDRRFRDGLKRMEEALSSFENAKIDIWLDLGDTINEGHQHFDAVFERFGRFAGQRWQVIGNHDYTIIDSEKHKVPALFGFTELHYFSKHLENYLFLFLDGNDISLHKATEGSTEKQTALNFQEEAKSKGLESANFWNGALSVHQLNWLEKELIFAENQGLKVIIFCHFPVLPYETHCLWNSQEVVNLLIKHKQVVKLWLNGHQHHGDYAEFEGIHFLTLNGMVQGEGNAYSLATLHENGISIKGFGRQKDYQLKW